MFVYLFLIRWQAFTLLASKCVTFSINGSLAPQEKKCHIQLVVSDLIASWDACNISNALLADASFLIWHSDVSWNDRNDPIIYIWIRRTSGMLKLDTQCSSQFEGDEITKQNKTYCFIFFVKNFRKLLLFLFQKTCQKPNLTFSCSATKVKFF